MDEVTYYVLQSLNLSQIKLIRLKEFETTQLLILKRERSVAEYCWTCTPALLAHVLEKHPDIPLLTYLDADLLFFSNPEAIYQESIDASSVIIEHRFSQGFENAAVNGKFNVQWVGIRRDSNGQATLKWWHERCLEWCFSYSEPERFGDQKYLDYWPIKFGGVHSLKNIGAGVGPWNFANYKIELINGQNMVDGIPLIFYHFHGYKMLDDGGFTAMPKVYMDKASVPYTVYEPYRHALWHDLSLIRRVLPNFVEGTIAIEQLTRMKRSYLIEPPASEPKSILARLTRRIKNSLQ